MADQNKKKYMKYEDAVYELVDGEARERLDALEAGTPRVAATAASMELQPNRLYVWPEMPRLSITLAAPTDPNAVGEYHFLFTSGAAATALTLPDSVLLPEGWETEPNRRYEISILEGCMSAQSWAVSANA